jgi:transposase
MNPQSHIPHAKRENSTSAGTQESLSQQDMHKWQLDYLNLQGIHTLAEPSCNDYCIRVEAEQSWSQKCPNCGCESKDVRPNGTRQQVILDEPRGLRSVRIQLRRRSYKCKVCGKAGLLPLDCLVEKRGITRRLLDYLENESLLRPFNVLAQEVGLSTRTVREIFKARVAVCDYTTVVTAPRVLGIDGVYIKRKECAILTDIEQGMIIDIWGSVTAATLTPALRQLPGWEKIEVVAMDMSKSLKSSINQAIPHAVIVIDRYHIQRMANEALDKVRKRLRPFVRRKNQFTMCKSSLLRKHAYQLKVAEKIELERWFSFMPELRAAYELKERFFAIWHTSCRATAQENYRQWLLSIPLELSKDFKKVITAMNT